MHLHVTQASSPLGLWSSNSDDHKPSVVGGRVHAGEKAKIDTKLIRTCLGVLPCTGRGIVKYPRELVEVGFQVCGIRAAFLVECCANT